MKKNFSFTAKVWKYNGPACWFFVNVDRDMSTKIHDALTGRAASMVKVEVTVKKVSWQTSMFWSKQDRSYILPLKAKMRYEIGILEGDTLDIKVKLL